MVWAGEERMRDGWMGGLVVGGMGGFKGWFQDEVFKGCLKYGRVRSE